VLKFSEATLNLASPRTDGSRYPVEGAQLVEYRPLDAVDGIGLELEAAFEIELVDRVDQSKGAIEMRSWASTLRVSPARRRPATNFTSGA
jgi:hypothetical protein